MGEAADFSLRWALGVNFGLSAQDIETYDFTTRFLYLGSCRRVHTDLARLAIGARQLGRDVHVFPKQHFCDRIVLLPILGPYFP